MLPVHRRSSARLAAPSYAPNPRREVRNMSLRLQPDIALPVHEAVRARSLPVETTGTGRQNPGSHDDHRYRVPPPTPRGHGRGVRCRAAALPPPVPWTNRLSPPMRRPAARALVAIRPTAHR